MPTPLRNLLTPRFSLRALLVVVTVGCVVIGWRANRLWQNQRALESLRQVVEVTANVGTDRPTLSFWHAEVDDVTLSYSGATAGVPLLNDAVWRDLKNLTPLRKIAFRNVALNGDSRPGPKISGVKAVDLYRCKLEPSGLTNIVDRLPALKSLELTWCDLDDPSDLASLENLPHLETLSFSLTDGIDSAVVPYLLRCSHLKSLTIDLYGISDAELERVADELTTALPNCNVIVICVSGNGLAIEREP